MNSRERVLRTFHFEPTDRAPFDLMEGCVWAELLDDFRARYGLQEPAQVIEFLDPDFRWTYLQYLGPPPSTPEPEPAQSEDRTYTFKVAEGPLAHAESLSDLDAYPWPDPSWLGPADYASARRRFPDKALVFCPGWMPLFWGACEAFGMQAALVNMVQRPDLFEAFVQRRHAYVMDILARAAPAAQGCCDIAWLGDDFAHQGGMIASPALWRKRIKPYLAEEVSLLRQHDLLVLFHSCGAVRPVLDDLIEIGVNGLLVFQTTAKGMDAASIARDFGGRLAFYGGVDIQRLLSFASPEDVETEVRANLRAFAGCGGYIVANSHHTVATIKGENIEAMRRAARETTSTASLV